MSGYKEWIDAQTDEVLYEQVRWSLGKTPDELAAHALYELYRRLVSNDDECRMGHNIDPLKRAPVRKPKGL